MTVGVAIESSAYSLWLAKQTARGSVAATADKKLRWVEGGLDIVREFGNENYGDGERFSNATDFTNTVMGSGDPGIQGQPDTAAWLIAQCLGTDTLSGPDGSGIYTHTLTPANAGGRWLTAWKKVGVAVGPVKTKFVDCRMGQLVIAASAGSKVLRLTPSIISISPEVGPVSDPVKAEGTEDALLWTECTGTFNIDGLGAGVIADIASMEITINDNLAAWYGDDVKPSLIVPGRGVIVVAYTLALTDVTLPQYNKVHYGTGSPAAGTAPTKAIYSGSLDFKFTRGAAATLRELQFTIPKINYSPGLAVSGQADGGVIELPMAGEARKSGASAMMTVVGKNVDNAAY